MTVKILKRLKPRPRPVPPGALHPRLLRSIGAGILHLRAQHDADPEYFMEECRPGFLGVVNTPAVLASVSDGGRPAQHWEVNSIAWDMAHVTEISNEEHNRYLAHRQRIKRRRKRLEQVRLQSIKEEARRMNTYSNHPRSLTYLRHPSSSMSQRPVLPPPISIHDAILVDEADARRAMSPSHPPQVDQDDVDISFSLSPGSSNDEGIRMGLREAEPSSPLEVSLNGGDPVQMSIDQLNDLVEADVIDDIQIVSSRTITAAEFNAGGFSDEDDSFQVLSSGPADPLEVPLPENNDNVALDTSQAEVLGENEQ